MMNELREREGLKRYAYYNDRSLSKEETAAEEEEQYTILCCGYA